MKRLLQILLPLVILVLSGGIVYLLLISKEEPERRRFQAPSPQVVARALEPGDFQIVLQSQGPVRARTEGALIPEVRGRITRVSENFQEGAFFEEGEVLLEIDDRDYRSELVVAEAALAQAELTLAQESARYEQAGRDWQRLNPDTDASALTLREPQIRQARAAVASAQARVESAQLNLERAKVRAPYAGRVLTKSVGTGQFVTTGTELARLYAVDFAEVRLPLTASQYEYLDLPTIYRGNDPEIDDGPLVRLNSSVGGNTYSWEGRIARSEGAVDARSRQIFVVAQVDDPYGRTVPGRPPLKVGTFVSAEIEGTVLEDVFAIPRRLYRENSYVLVVDEESQLERRKVEVVWENDGHIVVRDGLEAGALLCLTEVPYALEGWPVEVQMESDQPGVGMLAQSQGGERGSGGGIADRVDAIMAKFGSKLPNELKDKLVELKQSNDFARIRPVMGEVSSWAEENGEEMPASNWSGLGPRS